MVPFKLIDNFGGRYIIGQYNEVLATLHHPGKLGGSWGGFPFCCCCFYPKAPLLDLPNSYICIKIRLSSLSFIVPVRSRVEVRNISLPALTKTNLRSCCCRRQRWYGRNSIGTSGRSKGGRRKTTSEYQILAYYLPLGSEFFLRFGIAFKFESLVCHRYPLFRQEQGLAWKY